MALRRRPDEPLDGEAQAAEKPAIANRLDDDEPIRTKDQDELDRAPFAVALAANIATAPTRAGFAVGLTGPWGSGKTSIINMIKEQLKDADDIILLDFNPWMFSGTEQLVKVFFQNVGQQLVLKKDRDLKSLGEKLSGYGDAVSALAFVPAVGSALSILGTLLGVAGKVTASASKDAEKSLESRRDEIIAAIRKANKRILVVIDDIDRLRYGEVRDVMRLVKLTAHFPNFIYLLSFDRERVERALSEDYNQGIEDGRAYLEKILQITYAVPETRHADLLTILAARLNDVANRTTHGPAPQKDVTNIFHFVVQPLFRTLRDVRRYINTLPLTLEVIGDEVALADVLALEAIRIMAPDVFSLLPAAVEALTEYQRGTELGHNRDAARNAVSDQFRVILDAAGEHREAVAHMCSRLFPPSGPFVGRDGSSYGTDWLGTWRRERRVANPIVFRAFMEKSLPQSMLPARIVEALFAALQDPEALRDIVDDLNGAMLIEALQRLEDYEHEFPSEVAAGSIAVLMDVLPRLPVDRKPMGFPPSIALSRVVLRLVRRIGDEPRRLEIVEEALPLIDSIASRKELVDLVGHREGQGHRLVATEAATRLEGELRRTIDEAAPEQLATEPDLLRLLGRFYSRESPEDAERLDGLLANDEVLMGVLRSALSEAHRMSMGDVAVTTEYSLPWDWLVQLFSEERLVGRIRELVMRREVSNLDERTAAALDLAVKYTSGWRPVEFGAGFDA